MQGVPRIVPSKMVPQTTAVDTPAAQMTTLSMHSQIGDLSTHSPNPLSQRALKKLCMTRKLAPRGRRADLVSKLMQADAIRASTTWQTTGHDRVGQRVVRVFPEHGAVIGTVTAWQPASSSFEALFHIVHDDGDEEDLVERDVAVAADKYKESDEGKKSRRGEKARARAGIENVRMGSWSEEEVAKYNAAMAAAGGPGGSHDFHAVAKAVGTRSHLQVYDYYRRHTKKDGKDGEKGQGAVDGSLQAVVQRYMSDHGLSKPDTISLGSPSSLMSWLAGTYGFSSDAPAVALANRLRALLTGEKAPEGAAQGGGAGNVSQLADREGASAESSTEASNSDGNGDGDGSSDSEDPEAEAESAAGARVSEGAKETSLANITIYRVGERQVRVSDEQPPRFSVDEMVRLVCDLHDHDRHVLKEKALLYQKMPRVGRVGSVRKRAKAWLCAPWSDMDGLLAYCEEFRKAAHVDQVSEFRTSEAYRAVEKLFLVLQEVGPDHPIARAMESESEGRAARAADAAAGSGAAGGGGGGGDAAGGPPALLPGEAEFREDLERTCKDRTLEGKRLSVYWGGDRNWYHGTVLECRPGKFKMLYDDGEMSWETTSVQIGVRFLDDLAEDQPWRVLTFLNSEPYEASKLRLTGETPPRIALFDFLDCVLDVSAGKQKSVVRKLRKDLKKDSITDYIFVEGDGSEDRTQVVTMLELCNIMPLLPDAYTNRVRETGDLHRLQKMLRQESSVVGIELSVAAPGPGPDVRYGAAAGVQAQAKDNKVLDAGRWDEEWSPVLCPPKDGGTALSEARDSDPYMNPCPASLRLESRQSVVGGSAAALAGASSHHPGAIRLPCPPTAELRWLCTTGNLVGRRVSIYWPSDDHWYDGVVDECQPGRFKVAYDSRGVEPIVRWEVLGIGVHLLTRLPEGETMRKMFRTRSRAVAGRGRPPSAPLPMGGASAGHSAPDAPALEPSVLAVLMAPPFRTEGEDDGAEDEWELAGNGGKWRGAKPADWTPAEEQRLRELCLRLGPGRWEEKARALGSARSAVSCSQRYTHMCSRQKGDPLLARGFQLFPPAETRKRQREPEGSSSEGSSSSEEEEEEEEEDSSSEEESSSSEEEGSGSGSSDSSSSEESEEEEEEESEQEEDEEDDDESEDDEDEEESDDDEDEDSEQSDGGPASAPRTSSSLSRKRRKQANGSGLCEECGKPTKGTNYGTGRFCGPSCQGRFSRKSRRARRMLR